MLETVAAGEDETDIVGVTESVGEKDAENQAGTAPTLGLGLAEAASAPTAVFRPHHCGSATVAVRSQPDASTLLDCTAAGAGPHTYVTKAALARPGGAPPAQGEPPVKLAPVYWPPLTDQPAKEPKEVFVLLSAALSSTTAPSGLPLSARPWPPAPAPAPRPAKGE